MTRKICTANAIVKLLGTEGFNDETANTVKAYWMKHHCRGRAYERMRRLKKVFSAMVKEKLDDRDRLVLGKFLSVFARMHFDTGLTIGLSAKLDWNTSVELEYPFDDCEPPETLGDAQAKEWE